MDKMENIEQKLEQYKRKLLEQKKQRPLSKAQREHQRRERLHAQLQKAEVATERTDAKRVQELLRLCRYKARAGEWADIHGIALEIAQQTRSMVLGPREAHPILSARPPPAQVRAYLDAPPDGDDTG